MLKKASFAGVGDVSFQVTNEAVKPNYWLFTISTDSTEDLLVSLNENGVMLHSPYFGLR